METSTNLASTLSQFLDSNGLAAIFVVTLAKEIGVPVPIPGDVIMLAAAAQSASGRLVLGRAFAIILLAMVGGAWVQFLLVRKPGPPFLTRFGRYVGLTEGRLEAVAASVLRGGATAVALSLMTPGVRAATVPASGFGNMPQGAFLVGLLVGSTGFLALHFAIGLAVGLLLNQALGAANHRVLAVLALLILAGLGAWLAMVRHTGKPAEDRANVLERLRDWENAACPA